jgi:rod shape-determining protein MreD
MAERMDSKTWINRGVFILLAFVIVVIALVPRDLRPQPWAAFFLMTDFLFMRPPGLWAALVVVLTEVIRRQNHEFRNMPFMVEWGTIAVGLIAITVLNAVVLAVVMLPQPPLVMTLTQTLATILVYPFVLLAAHFIFGVTRTAPGETGSKGHLL